MTTRSLISKCLFALLFIGAAIRDGHTIKGGALARRKELPFMVGVFIQDKKKKPVGACDGSLVSEDSVVMGAHCLFNENDEPFDDDYEIFVIGGTIAFSIGIKTPLDDTAVQISVKEKFIHKSYEHGSNRNNVAVVRLEKKFQLNDYIKPISVTSTRFPDGKDCKVHGWGAVDALNRSEIDYLLSLEVLIKKPEDCKKILHYEPTSSQYCITPIMKMVGAFLSSSGGLMVCDKVLAGIASNPKDVDSDGAVINPIIYTDLSQYKSFIENSSIQCFGKQNWNLFFVALFYILGSSVFK